MSVGVKVVLSNSDLTFIRDMRGQVDQLDDEKMKNGAQIVPKICQEYQNASKNIERYRILNRPAKPLIIYYLHYFLRITFLECFLHTVEVTGSNPVSPIFSFPRG